MHYHDLKGLYPIRSPFFILTLQYVIFNFPCHSCTYLCAAVSFLPFPHYPQPPHHHHLSRRLSEFQRSTELWNHTNDCFFASGPAREGGESERKTDFMLQQFWTWIDLLPHCHHTQAYAQLQDLQPPHTHTHIQSDRWGLVIWSDQRTEILNRLAPALVLKTDLML